MRNVTSLSDVFCSDRADLIRSRLNARNNRAIFVTATPVTSTETPEGDSKIDRFIEDDLFPEGEKCL